MAKQNRDAIVSELIPLIRQGKKRGDVIAMIAEKWRFSPRSFDRYWKFANDAFQEQQDSIRQATLDAETAAALDAQNGAYLTIASKRKILNEIAAGTLETKVRKPVWDPNQKKFAMVEVIEYPDHGARVRAIIEDNKMMGHIAMDKGAGKIPDDAPPANIAPDGEKSLKMSVDDVIKLAKAMNG